MSSTNASTTDSHKNDRFRVTASLPDESPVSVDIDLRDLLFFNQANTTTNRNSASGNKSDHSASCKVTISRLSSSHPSSNVPLGQPGDLGLSHDQNLIVSGLIESHKRKEELQSESKSEKWLRRSIAIASMVIACGSAYNVLSIEDHLQSLKRDNGALRNTVQVYNDTLTKIRGRCPELSVESYITDHNCGGEEGGMGVIVVNVRE